MTPQKTGRCLLKLIKTVEHCSRIKRGTRKNIKKKPTLGRLGKKETTALNFQENYNAFRIRCIMLILEEIKNYPIEIKKNIYL